MPIWPRCSPINAGVFFCKGAFGRELMREWQALYPSRLWKKEDGAWNVEDHVWAGPDLEQGAFARTLFAKYSANPAVKQVSWKILQSPHPRKESFTLHFQHRSVDNCLLYLWDIQEATPLPRQMPVRQTSLRTPAR